MKERVIAYVLTVGLSFISFLAGFVIGANP